MPQLRSGRGLAVSPPGGGSHRLRSRRGRRGRGAGDAAGGRGEVAELPAGKGWARAPGRRRQLLPSVEALAGGPGAVQSTEAESGDSSWGLAEQVAGVEEQAGSLPVSGGSCAREPGVPERRVGGRREKDGDALTLGQRVLTFEGKHRGLNERSGGAVGDVGKSRQRSFSEPGVQVPKEPGSPVQEDRHASVELGSGGAAESPRKRGRCSLSEPGPQEKERCPGERGESFLAEVGLSGPLEKEGNLGKQDRLIVEPKLQKPKKRGRYSLGMWQPLGARELASSRKREKHSLELESQSLGLQGAVSSLGEVGEHFCSVLKLELQSMGLQESTESPKRRSKHSMVVPTMIVPYEGAGNTIKRGKLSATNLQPINLSLQGGERTVGKRARSSSVKLWQSGSQNEAEILEKASKNFSEGGRLSENRKKSSSTEKWVTEYVEERLMPRRVSLTGTTQGNRQGKLDKQQASGQEVISAPTNDLFINRLEDDGERQTDGNEETVVSSELKLKIRKPTKKKGMDLNEVPDAQVEKQLETAQNTAKESSVRTSSLVAYSESFQLPQSDGTQSKITASRCVASGSAVDCNRTKNKITKIKCLQRLTVQTAENKLTSKSIECKDECREALKQHNSLLSIAEKNPVVALHDCRYLNTFVKSSVDGSNNSYKIDSGFLHALHGKTVCPGSVTGQSGMNAARAERWCARGIISFDEEGTCQNREKCFSCSLNRNKCFRESKWNIGEKPRKKMKLFERTEKLATQNVLPGRVNSECELHTENKTLATVSLAVLGELNSNKICLSSSCDLISNAHVENNTKKALNSLPKPVSRKMCVKPGAIEDSFEKNLQLPEAAQREKSFFNAESMAPQDHSNLKSPGVIRLVSDISNCCSDSGSCQKKLLNEKLFKKPEKLQAFSCQRAIPMTGKNVWPRESCARTSVWFPKKDKSIIEKKNSLTSFQGCSHQNTKTLRGMDVTDNSKQLDLHMSMTEINKQNACKITDSNTECLASVAILESSLSDINGALRVTKDENLELSLDKGRSSMTFNSGSVQEGKITLNLSGKQKQDKNKGALKAKNVAMTSQDSMCADNVGKMICNPEMPVTKQTQEFPGLVRTLSTGNLSNFKIPLLRNKTESRKVDYIRSFERETYSPLELLDNSAATPIRQNRSKENSPLVYSDFFLATAKEKAYQITNKDLGNDDSERLSDEKKRLAEHVSACPWDFPERELMSLTSEDTFGTEFREKSNEADHSSKIVKHSTSSEVFVNDEKKLKEKPTQSSSTNFPDVLKAYEDDILVIDVIQDDPDLFGTTNEGEFELDCETEKHGNTLTPVEKQNFTPKFHDLQENKDSNYYHEYARDSPIQESGTLQPIADSCDSLVTANEINKHDSSRGSSPLGGVTEESSEDGQLTESDEHTKGSNVDEKYRFSGKSSVKEEKDSIYEKSSDSECAEFVSPDLSLGLQLPCLEVKAHHGSTVHKPGMNDFRYSGKCPLLPHPNSNCYEPWKMDKSVPVSHSIQKILEIELPRKYCRFYFNTLRGCERAECWFWHVPEQGDEKICMAVLRTYININETSLLQRAVQIFMNYYREVIPGVHFDLQVLNDLLIALLKHCLLKEVFPLLNIGIMIKRLPPIDVILKVFEHVASMNNREAVPKLIDAFCKLFDAGMGFESEHFNYIVKFLHQLQVSSQEINTVLNIKSRFQAKQFKKNWLCDINMAIAEIQHCKEKSDWSSLGTLYINVRMGCQNFGDLQKLTLCIAEILTRDSTGERPGVPFCEFAETVIKNPQHNEGDKIFLGRIGINVMYSYHRVLQWSKGRKVLDKLHEFQIYFTSLKGLTGPERLASRCQIVNVAAEIFLKSGSLDGATWILRDSEWVIDTAVWPCDRMDVLSRHNLLCALACEYLTKSQYRQTFEILQNLPGFQTCSDTLDVSQYSLLFNKLLDACIESKSLGVSSSVIDFMFSKNVPIDFTLLRGLITTLGRSCLWLKARTYYKSALSLGCYPPLEGNLYRKLLLIPSYMSEVEMLLAIEIFLVSNASNIQSPGATSQTLQIILKRCEEHKVQSKDDYRTAMDRVILAARISDPKLFLKHMTMNINMEQVYSLEHNSAIKWLKENMKWAGKVWLFQ